ncbi:hypothetical protein ACU4GR_25355 [Methylobacterium oryzae CBMB20]
MLPVSGGRVPPSGSRSRLACSIRFSQSSAAAARWVAASARASASWTRRSACISMAWTCRAACARASSRSSLRVWISCWAASRSADSVSQVVDCWRRRWSRAWAATLAADSVSRIWLQSATGRDG